MDNGTYAHYHDNTSHGEDAFLIRELSLDSVLDAVLDGLTEKEEGTGKIASTLTADKLRYDRIQKVQDVIDLLTQANQELYETTEGAAKTTATVALKLGKQLYIVNVGDSPAYLIREGKIMELTTLDKSPIYHAVCNRVIGEIPGLFRYHKNQIDLQSGDRLVLVTDGIIDNLFPEEILSVVNKSQTPQEAVRGLEMRIDEKRSINVGRRDVFRVFKPDDATAIIRYFPTA